MSKAYIGDGVYVEFDGFSYVLTTEDGYGVSNRIVLEYGVFDALTQFVKTNEVYLRASRIRPE